MSNVGHSPRLSQQEFVEPLQLHIRACSLTSRKQGVLSVKTKAWVDFLPTCLYPCICLPYTHNTFGHIRQSPPLLGIRAGALFVVVVVASIGRLRSRKTPPSSKTRRRRCRFTRTHTQVCVRCCVHVIQKRATEEEALSFSSHPDNDLCV